MEHGDKNKWKQQHFGRNIDSSMHCNIFFFPFQHRFRKSSIDSGKQRPQTTRWPSSLGPHLQQLEPPRPWPRSRVRRWCTAETPSELRRWVAVFCVPVGCTLLRGERGVQCQHVTPLHLAGGRRDRGYVYAYVRQKCTMQSQKQWYSLSLTMVAPF